MPVDLNAGKGVGMYGKYFTIVELLIIIAMMTVLATILFPSFSKAISRAHASACGSNIRQIAISFQAYKSDTREMPIAWRWLDDFTPVSKYIRSPRVFRCPARRLAPITDISALNGGTDYYYYNGWDFLDIELHNNLNNGHGNNDSAYKFDPSNPTFARAAARKSKIPRIYDKSGPIHFRGINASVLYDCHIEYRTTMYDLWTLNEKGELDLRLTGDFP